MEEVKNLTQDDVLELIKDFPVEPMRNRIIITTNVEEFDEEDIHLEEAAFSPEQFVLAVGSYSKDVVKPGQKVSLDIEAMTVRIPNDNDAYQPLTRVQIKPVQVGEYVFGMITDDKIEYKIIG